MLRRFQLDSLLIFLVLSVGVLTVSVNDRNILLGIEPVYQTDLRISEQVGLTLNNRYVKDINVYNPSLYAEISVDGGDTWTYAGSEVILEEVRMNYLLGIPTSPRWLANDGNFPELHSVRVRVIDPINKKKTEEAVYNYFPKSFTDLSIVSLNTSQRGLFDWYNGIMVQGYKSTVQGIYHNDWWFLEGNYQNRGIDAERAVNFQVFNGSNDQIVNVDCGLRINGNATRAFPQKSLRVQASKLYGSTILDGFGIDHVTSLVLRNSGNDNTKTLFSDLFVHSLFGDTEIQILTGGPAHVFINGNYWGLYNLRERIDENYVAQKHGWKPEEVTILEEGDAKLKVGSEDEKFRFDLLIAGLPNGDLSQISYEAISDEIDIGSFIDYIIAETFIANRDWPYNNSIWYCKNGKKWKWILNDTDVSLAYPGADNVNSNLFEMLESNQSCTAKLWRALISNGIFKKLFIERVAEMMDGELSEKFLRYKFASIKEKYEQSDIELTIRRWRSIGSVEEWEENCQANLDFLIKRRDIYLQQVNAL